MGRELKRVDLSNPPKMNQAWHGFINPFYDHCKPCLACEHGYSAAASLYSDQWYGKAPFDPVEYGAKPLEINGPAFKDAIRWKVEREIKMAKRDGKQSYYTKGGRVTLEDALRHEESRMFAIQKGQWCCQLIQDDVDALVEAGRLVDLTSDWTKEDGWRKREGVVVTADQVNAWDLSGMGHDSINQWICVKSRCLRNGNESTCKTCDGYAETWESPELKMKAETWEEFEPPTGAGYQIWETVSSGSPVSPAFVSPEGLAKWMVANDDSVTSGKDFDTWMKFIDVGWAPSGVSVNGRYQDGVAAVTRKNN